MKNNYGQLLSGGQFNTLAQTGTDLFNKSVIIVNGNGSDLTNSGAIKGRAKRKVITKKMSLSLVDVSKKKGKSNLKKSYWNAYHCQDKVYTANGRLYTKYCKNRFCTLCCAIRKADIINRYLPVIKTWEKPCLVTLTFKSCPHAKLRKFFEALLRGFRKISSKYKKRNQRGNSIKIMGIKSLECNFNPKKRTYNPHFHIIVPDEQTANILVKEWLTYCTPKFTDPQGQKIQVVFNNEVALLEVVKYGSKIFTEPDVNKKAKDKRLNKGEYKLYIAALNNIFVAMKGLRIFERFGFNLPKKMPNQTSAKVIDDYYTWIFDSKYSDWLNSENELILSGYEPNAELVNLLENNIDTNLE